MIELERLGIVDERTASIIKTLILEENHQVIQKFDEYEGLRLNHAELGFRLSRLAIQMSAYCERPQSPLPKRKQELMTYVNSLARYYF